MMGLFIYLSSERCNFMWYLLIYYINRYGMLSNKLREKYWYFNPQKSLLLLLIICESLVRWMVIKTKKKIVFVWLQGSRFLQMQMVICSSMKLALSNNSYWLKEHHFRFLPSSLLQAFLCWSSGKWFCPILGEDLSTMNTNGSPYYLKRQIKLETINL
jgi:hypothetical protein